MFKTSEKIRLFFQDIYSHPRCRFFWELMDSNPVYDAELDEVSDANIYEDFEKGFALAKKAGKKDIYVYHGDCFSYYFVGSETSILRRLQKLKSEFEKETDETRKIRELSKEEQRIQKQMDSLAASLDKVQQKKRSLAQRSTINAK